MLVLSRKSGQELVIGDNVRITVNRVSGNRVTLGISAPEEVRIVRGELEPIMRSFEVEVPIAEAESEEPVATSVAAPWIAHEGGLHEPMPRQPH
ncbi:MAG: carbon storage regulator [Planctomycetaceae bacterium]|nr:carbon storage regulator [Planctomycetaceae bacterium]